MSYCLKKMAFGRLKGKLERALLNGTRKRHNGPQAAHTGLQRFGGNWSEHVPLMGLLSKDGST